MKLYHYSKEKYDVLKTLEAQGPISKKDKEDAINLRKWRLNVPPGLYYQHISFFFDKIEKGHWRYYPADHKTWFKGNELFEYEVDVSSMPDFKWSIVETPEIIKARMDESISEEDFWKLYKKINLSKYVGDDRKAFEKASQEFIGKTRPFVIAAMDDPNQEDRAKYAAGIPHAMLYPTGGVIQYQSVKPIRI